MNKLYLLKARLFDMKKFYPLIAFLLFISHQGKSQDYKNELGIGVFKVSVNKFIGAVRSHYVEYEFPFTSISLNNDADYFRKAIISTPSFYYSTRIYKNLRFRGGFQFVRTQLPDLDNNGNYGIHAIRKKIDSYNFWEGLQYSILRKRKLSPYLFTDLVLLMTRTSEKYYDVNDNFKASSNSGSHIHFRHDMGIGIKYKLSKRFSTSLECNSPSFNTYFPISRLSINYNY